MYLRAETTLIRKGLICQKNIHRYQASVTNEQVLPYKMQVHLR